MQKELLLLSVVLVTLQSQLVSMETCENLRPATSTFTPRCDDDIFIKWPNYKDPTTYYVCRNNNKPVLLKCPTGTFFTYVLQDCVPCADAIPPPECSNLPIKDPQCRPINGGSTSSPGETTNPTGPTLSTLPTPKYPPSDGTTKPPATTKTTPTATTKSSTTKPEGNTTPTPGTTFPTPPTVTSSTQPPSNSTDIPPPPSPTTKNTLIPLPPTPPPTPPSISVEPPYVDPKPSS